MNKRRWGVVTTGLIALAGVGGLGGRWLARRRNRPGGRGAGHLNGSRPVVERRAQSDPVALDSLVAGMASRVGLDLERLKTLKEANFKPLVEYLSYIQTQRGSTESLVFVRRRDLEHLAGLAGQAREDFLARFKKLGVVLSMN